MTTAIALTATSLSPVAEELYEVLRQIDPAVWRDDLVPALRHRLAHLRERLAAILDGTDAAWHGAAATRLRQRLRDMAAVLEELPDQADSIEQLRERWARFRAEALPRYEKLVTCLRAFEIHVPSLRPTNYRRNLFHFGNGVLTLAVNALLGDMRLALAIAGALAATAWTLEASRRVMPRWNALLMRVFAPIAHPHEHWRVNSGTWFLTALAALALIGSYPVAVLALAVLATGDPAAAIVGRRYGRVKLVHGRSLEGSLTFLAVGFLAALAAGALLLPALPHLGPLAFAAALGGGLAELFARRVDDNLAIPLGAAAATGLAMAALGMIG